MRFVLDECVSHPLAGLLRSRGYDADSAKEVDRLGITDVEVLTRAADTARTVITRNARDFRALHEAWLRWRRRWAVEAVRASGVPVALSGHSSILIVPHLPVHALADIVEPFADAYDSIDDRLFSWSDERGWHEIVF